MEPNAGGSDLREPLVQLLSRVKLDAHVNVTFCALADERVT